MEQLKPDQPGTPAIAPLRLLSAKDASKALAISERTLWAITAPRGPLPVVKIGTRCLYDPADLAKYVESAKKNGGAA